MNELNPILLFDGDCKFCNFWVQFIQKRKPKRAFKFFPLQSAQGKILLHKYEIISSTDSVVFIWKERAYIKSNAAFQIIKQLGPVWRLLLIGLIIPRSIRDWMYDIVAKNRNRFFTSKTECEIH